MSPMRVALIFFLACSLLCDRLAAQEHSPVQLTLDTSEADEALRIIRKQNSHEFVTDSDWQQLFATAPYQWLKAREEAIGAPFTDQQFQAFLLSPETLARQQEWAETLADMSRVDMHALGVRVLAWLPDGASIRAQVFPEIKPKQNSFVWTKPDNGPAIFLYLERQTKAKFENTVAHECHHIGLQSLGKEQDVLQGTMSPVVKTAVGWMSAFGEGEAMLAAVGSTDLHPHWEDDALARARWDGDLMHFNADLATLQQFFTDILDGKLQGDDAIRERAAPFWGDVQGAWYTVGYEMSVLVEKRNGRQAFTECLIDPRKLLIQYNQVALEANKDGATLATWSPAFLNRLKQSR